MSALSLGGSWFVKQDRVAESFAVGPEQIMTRHLHCIILDIPVTFSQNTNCQKKLILLIYKILGIVGKEDFRLFRAGNCPLNNLSSYIARELAGLDFVTKEDLVFRFDHGHHVNPRNPRDN